MRLCVDSATWPSHATLVCGVPTFLPAIVVTRAPLDTPVVLVFRGWVWRRPSEAGSGALILMSVHCETTEAVPTTPSAPTLRYLSKRGVNFSKKKKIQLG